jgi:hypothetical protein
MAVGENILALTHRRASVRRGAVGWDGSCRRLLWLWRGDRSGGRSNGGGDRSSPVAAVRVEEGDAVRWGRRRPRGAGLRAAPANRSTGAG